MLKLTLLPDSNEWDRRALRVSATAFNAVHVLQASNRASVTLAAAPGTLWCNGWLRRHQNITTARKESQSTAGSSFQLKPSLIPILWTAALSSHSWANVSSAAQPATLWTFCQRIPSVIIYLFSVHVVVSLIVELPLEKSFSHLIESVNQSEVLILLRVWSSRTSNHDIYVISCHFMVLQVHFVFPESRCSVITKKVYKW